jgi:hypothetical protein
MCSLFLFSCGDLSVFFNAKMEAISETLAYIDITHRSGGCPLLNWYLCERDVCCVEDEL